MFNKGKIMPQENVKRIISTSRNHLEINRVNPTQTNQDDPKTSLTIPALMKLNHSAHKMMLGQLTRDNNSTNPKIQHLQ